MVSEQLMEIAEKACSREGPPISTEVQSAECVHTSHLISYSSSMSGCFDSRSF